MNIDYDKDYAPIRPSIIAMLGASRAVVNDPTAENSDIFRKRALELFELAMGLGFTKDEIFWHMEHILAVDSVLKQRTGEGLVTGS